jgi:hypothetical protein
MYGGYLTDFSSCLFVQKLTISIYQPPNYSCSSNIGITNPFYIKKIMALLCLSQTIIRDRELLIMIFERFPRSVTLDMRDYTFRKDLNPKLTTSDKSFCVLINKASKDFSLEIWTLDL